MYTKKNSKGNGVIYTEEEIYPYQLLAAAIIRTACKDYCAILNRRAINLDSYTMNKQSKDNVELRRIEEFFHSHYFRILSNSDPEWMLGVLREKFRDLNFNDDLSIF